MTALQQVVPVNGLMSIKGDGAKSLILNSGVVKPGTWKEVEEGSLANGSFAVTISAERLDNGERLSRSFSVEQAKKAGLWVTDEQLKAQDGYKWKKSSWYKYPDRMIKYRALGFLARDLFPDVMAGTYTEEEARDIPPDTTQVIETHDGAKIILPDKSFAQERSQALTQRAVDKIDNHQEKLEKKFPNMPEGTFATAEKDQPPQGSGGEAYTEEELKNKKVEELLLITEVIPDLQFAVAVIEGKNTNKKLREIILAYQRGELANMVHPRVLPSQEEPRDLQYAVSDSEAPPMEEIIVPDDGQHDLTPPERGSYTPVPLDIPDLPDGAVREFSSAAGLYGALNNKVAPAITDKRFLEVVATIPQLATKFKDKEDFCRRATVSEVEVVVQKNGVV
jgi:hypothetical protein